MTQSAVPRRVAYDTDEFTPPPVELPDDSVPRETGPLPLPERTRVFVIANQKGGVGKTTTTVNLAAGLANGGLRVLVIDLDPQGNASTALGIDHNAGVPGTYEVLIDGEPIDQHVQQSPEADNLWVLPATIDLAGAEIGLVDIPGRESRLLRALDRLLQRHRVDYIFIDCPPSLSLLTLNAMAAADSVLVPIQCEYYALEGVGQLMNTLNLVRRRLNPRLDVEGVVLTMLDGRTNLGLQVVGEVKKYFKGKVFKTVVPRNVRLSEAPSHGLPIHLYDARCPGADAYRRLAAELIERNEG